ncbi:MAG: hypothetical protein HQL69_14985 [Magnetococcales bacterium]|nr:hypothetical protein [Magnetococcales bacterium]
MLRFKQLFISCSVLVGLLFSTVALADNLIVYSAKGIQLKSGAIISSTEGLTLQSGQELSLISPTGKMIKLVGPFNGLPMGNIDEKNKKSVKEALLNLLSDSGRGEESFGITRSTDDVFKLANRPAPLPTPWVLDVTKDGPYCYREGDQVIFWRSNKTKSTKIRIEILEHSWNAKTVWSKGKSQLASPSAMPVIDGAVYQITLNKNSSKGSLNVVPDTLQSKLAQAAWLKEKGCISQFKTLVHSFL